MCKAFSCIATRTKVYWKVGLDGHEDIKKQFNLSDDDTMELVPIEITPDKGYLHPEGKWTLRFDNTSAIAPEWWKQSNEQKCFDAMEQWKKEVYSMINMKEVLKPINPLKIKPVTKITKEHKRLLKEWASVENLVWNSVENLVWDSVRDSVGDSVGDSVWNSVWNSVRTSVGNSVWNSVWNLVWTYFGSLFKLDRNQWKYTNKIKTKGYPFQPAVDLWKQGLVPSFDGKIWRLHTGKKAKVVFEITGKELKEAR